jgi:hypothetical protein
MNVRKDSYVFIYCSVVNKFGRFSMCRSVAQIGGLSGGHQLVPLQPAANVLRPAPVFSQPSGSPAMGIEEGAERWEKERTAE